MAELNTSEKTGRRSGLSRTAARVDLTAMVDLAFLLITFFMLTTTLQKNNAMPVAMPDKTEVVDVPGVPASRTMTVCLGKNDKALLYMGEAGKPSYQKVVDYGRMGLRQSLLAKQQDVKATTGKDMIVLIKPSDHSIYNNLVNTLDEMNIAKVERYAIVDIADADINLLKKQQLY
ncbi:biopolymer transporter ExbD [Mucilaginibacter sp. RS28]|uniref:Biopolymer transporter ExbD n=1 Tax=Mucilaginibacter straminoryzae TaxID=2932774 RepID=A0A9X1X5T7_9SPHI|nr:biopolymer transporter ExbD [Mucilaginibacter straminoryzae]MCJ8210148.1 biopolymer transporter ExbD [Mucilaginibacter straminoryzae]